MKKILGTAQILLMLFMAVAVAASDLDLQTLIAGIKHFDESVTSGKGEFVYTHQMGDYEEKRTYALTFKGIAFEDANLRVDYSEGAPLSLLTEMYDSERQWEIVNEKNTLLIGHLSNTDWKQLNTAPSELPAALKHELELHELHISDDFRIQPASSENTILKLIDADNGRTYYLEFMEETLRIYEENIEYAVRPRCMIHAPLDPRYWMTIALGNPASYLMTPLWKVFEDKDTELLGTELLNGEETYRVRIKEPDGDVVTFYISPEKGFRLVKVEEVFQVQESSRYFKKGIHYLKELEFHYKEYLPDVWFPESIVQTYHVLLAEDPAKKGDRIGKSTLRAVSLELNVDVSGKFQLDVPEDTPVFDYGSGELRPYRVLKQPSQ